MSERWLVVGLGNPGKQYEKTRHNVGFMAIEHLSRLHHIVGKGEVRFNAIVGTGHIMGYPVVLVQPTTFMNLSGEAAVKVAHFYKIPVARCILVYDEADLPFGKLRVRPSGSAAGHNGVKSIIQCFGGDDGFPRVRIGIGLPDEEHQKPMHHHVLSRFSQDEQPHLPAILNTASDAIVDLLSTEVGAVMTKYNGLNLSETP